MAPIAPLRRPRVSTGGFAHTGFVRFDEQVYPCGVMDMSSTGAILTFRSPVELPERFTLLLTSNGNVTR